MGGKSHIGLGFFIDEAHMSFSSERHEETISSLNKKFFNLRKEPIIEVCENCLGVGKTVITGSIQIPCIYCNGSGYVKKCACGSGIKIGKNEFSCLRCKHKPKPDFKAFLSPNIHEIYPHAWNRNI